MKTSLYKIYATLVLSVLTITMNSCSKEEQLSESQLDYTPPTNTELDQWILKNYTDPYNIAVQYKWNRNMSTTAGDVFPPQLNTIKPSLECIKKVLISSFNTLGGANFVKKQPIKQLYLIGRNLDDERNLKEDFGGVRYMVVFGTDKLDLSKYESVALLFMQPIFFDFIKILNQSKPFDEKSWSKITPLGYTPEYRAYIEYPEVSLFQGFISAFARENIYSDFAETAAMLLTLKKTDYDNIIRYVAIGDKNFEGSIAAANALKIKEAFIVKYFNDAFKIDFYALRKLVQKNIEEINSKTKT